MSERVDAIGQKLEVGGIVVCRGNTLVITKINPKTIRLNGGGDAGDKEVVVVTDNLIALGKEQIAIDLRTEHAAAMVYEPAPQRKIPVRYLIVGNPRSESNSQWLIRIEVLSMSDARTAFHEVMRNAGIQYTHKVSESKKSWQTSGNVFLWTKSYYLESKELIAARNIPDCMAGLISHANPVIEIPEGMKFEGGFYN